MKEETENLSIHPIVFIREVEKRPELYKGDPLNRVRKLELWTEIGDAVFKDWSDLGKAAIHDRIVLLQKRWKSFKDTYNREIRLRKAGDKQNRKVYKFFKYLKFLGGHEDLPHPDDDIDTQDDDGIYFHLEDDLDEGNVYKKEPDYGHDDADDPPRGIKRKSSRKQKAKKKRVSEDFEYHSFTEELPVSVPVYAEEDGDRLFMLSFLSEMKKLPVNIKMWARSQISNVMQEAVMCSLNNSQPGLSGMSYENKYQDRASNVERNSSSSSD